ncbi:MAG: DNA internalization-related competence protein ComEC/Rec2 [Candidatus Saganbacteria bacterium]|nr:DNA internalization-related competence protein ComEC/Rec2 [Candidatus Saganbacteria bacterium]
MSIDPQPIPTTCPTTHNPQPAPQLITHNSQHFVSPLILITISYVLGIILGNLKLLPLWLTLILSVSVFLCIFYFLFKKQPAFYLLLALIVLLGMFYTQFRSDFISPQDISHFISPQRVTIVGQIVDEPKSSGDLTFFTLDAKHLVADESAFRVSGKASVTYKGEVLISYGDSVCLSGILSSLEALQNPGLFSYSDYLEREGIHSRFQVKKDGVKIFAKGGFSFTKTALYLQKRLVHVSTQTLPSPYDTLLSGIVLGSKAAKIPSFLSDAYRRAGVSHLLVASGMQITILIGIFVSLGKFFNLPVWLIALLSTAANILCTLIVGGGPSILRAAFMSQAAIFSLLFERKGEFYTSFSLAALVLLVINPLTLFDIGFQLSFAATWSLVYISPVLAELLKSEDKHPRRFLCDLFSVSLSPVLATAPVCAFHFSEFSLVGVITNFLILPWVSVLLILGFVSAVTGIFFLPLAYLINNANLFLLVILNWIVITLSSLPFATFVLATPNFIWLVFYYLGLVFVVEIIRHNNSKVYDMETAPVYRGRFPTSCSNQLFGVIVLVLIIFACFVWHEAFEKISPALKITVLDVGQGDSILVEAPTGEKMLVDGGDVGKGEKIIIPYLKKKGITSLDVVVLTHPHADHLLGLLEVMQKVKVEEVFDSGQSCDFSAYRIFLALVAKNKIKYRVVEGGQIYTLANGVKMRFLNPSKPYLSGTNSDTNSNSIAFQLLYKNFSMLFTGDMEIEGEERVLSRFSQEMIGSQALKVGHHGSRTATSPPFLEAVSPHYAIISCGRHNKFRHPHRSTLQKLKEKGIKLYRTDVDGAVQIETDGGQLVVRK